jgi:hypothetical protein
MVLKLSIWIMFIIEKQVFFFIIFLPSNFFTSFLILTSRGNNTRCYVKPTILTDLLDYSSITFMSNSTKSKMTVVCQIRWTVVFILETCPHSQYLSNSIQLEIEIEPEEIYVEELCRIYTIGYRGIADVWSNGFRSFSSDIWKNWGDHHLKYTSNGDDARWIFDQLEVFPKKYWLERGTPTDNFHTEVV